MIKKSLIFIVISAIIISGIVILINTSDNEQGISIIAVGDSIGYNIENENLTHLPELIQNTDIFLVNLEGVLLDSQDEIPCESLPNQSLFTSDETFAKLLKLAPITIANLANNHILDCAPASPTPAGCAPRRSSRAGARPPRRDPGSAPR